jgi:hypothetical protein
MKNFRLKTIIREIKQLYCSKNYSTIHWQIKIMYICILNIYYLALYNYTSINGNNFTIGMIFGISDMLGTLLGEYFLRLVPDWIGMLLSIIIVMVASVLLKMPGIDQMTTYAIFFSQIFFINIAYNAAGVILESRTNPKHLAEAFENYLCFGSSSAMVCPVIALQPEPAPTIMFMTCGFMAVLMLFKIGP